MLRCGFIAVLGAALSVWNGSVSQAETMPPPSGTHYVATPLAEIEDPIAAATALLAEEMMNVDQPQLLQLERTPDAETSFTLTLPIDGETMTIAAAPHDVRSTNYRLIVQGADGLLRDVHPGAARTFRGVVDGRDGTIVTGALLDDGMHLMIQDSDGERLWMEPVAARLPIAAPETYLVYRSRDVAAHDGTCGMPDLGPDHDDALDAAGIIDEAEAAAPLSGAICVAELACDADVQYFNQYGSVSAVEARITSIINTVNVQYENQVGLTHSITAIVVRTAEPDPYVSTDASELLCQFITEWTDNQTGVQRDVAHLFTGRNLDGTTIGIASDIGGSGICMNQGACTGGPFGPIGSYCLAQSDAIENFACVTDLTAHELGHLWGAFHCDCPSHTMNAGLTCANSFSLATILSIIDYRNDLDCLGGPCDDQFVSANDACADAETIPATISIDLDNSFATPIFLGDDDPDLPAGSPSCQWDDDPDAVHNTLWYRFVATDTSISIETCSDLTTATDTILALFSGSCGSLIELACGEDDCGQLEYLSRLCYNGLTPGETYLVMVGCPGGYIGSNPGPIRLDLDCPCPEIGPVAGACCLPDVTCVDAVTEAMCDAMGGVFRGSGSGCSIGVICMPIFGACCLPATCIVTTEPVCTSSGGVYQGNETSCDDVNCPPPTGACCYPDGSCAVLLPGECVTKGGLYQGHGASCAAVQCPLPAGACCFDDGTCVELQASECFDRGGAYQGTGLSCAQAECPQPCAADLDGDDDVGFGDLVEILSAWGSCAGCAEDLDGDGVVGFSDLVIVLSAWGACA